MNASERQAMLIELLTQHLLGQATQGELLLKLRKQVLRYNQTQFSELVGISRRALSDLENDKGSPSTALIAKVFKPFGLRPGLVPIHRQIGEKVVRTDASQTLNEGLPLK
ncbi:helix-turn-helix transcriptional regulator [Salinibius halmophilus]|uniref:helix-turn-helix transcriptional regulator n=1 Tax=Salinibius halmophilus TaxID=1853216 RepID=UPI000E66D714|nr:helix-turn-helix transcriptional regulator [Salinibius halmophilus]